MTTSSGDGKLRLCLIVEMLIDPRNVDKQVIKDQTLEMVRQAAIGGLLVGTSGAELIEHTAYISPYTRSYQEVPAKEDAA